MPHALQKLVIISLLFTSPMAINSVVAESQCAIDDNAAQLLKLHNQARVKARHCGADKFSAAPALKWHCDLASAAQTHAKDMSNNDFLSHRGTDGSSFTGRIDNVGFGWRAAAENVGHGYKNGKVASEAWLKSVPHCANIMNDDYQYFGAAKVGDHWATLFAR